MPNPSHLTLSTQLILGIVANTYVLSADKFFRALLR